MPALFIHQASSGSSFGPDRLQRQVSTESRSRLVGFNTLGFLGAAHLAQLRRLVIDLIEEIQQVFDNTYG